MMTWWLLAQADPTGVGSADPVGQAWWRVLLDQSLLLVVLFIFVTAVVTLVLERRRRDKCLKLFHAYHVTCVSTSGRALWGDLLVYPNALELVFDEPYTNAHGITKSSALLYADRVGELLAVGRSIRGLTPEEARRRRRQLRARFRPGPIRRALRWWRNLLNTLRDAFQQALSALLTAVMVRRPVPGLAEHRTSVDQIGRQVIAAAGNTYEPMLERHIGRPVVLRLQRAGEVPAPGGGDGSVEMPGFLVDYSDQWVAIANIEHRPSWQGEVSVSRDRPEATGPGWTLKLQGPTLLLQCPGDEAVVIADLHLDGRGGAIETALLPGGEMRLHVGGETNEARLTLERTRRLDICAPRSRASVLFGGEAVPRADSEGLATRPALSTGRSAPASQEI